MTENIQKFKYLFPPFWYILAANLKNVLAPARITNFLIKIWWFYVKNHMRHHASDPSKSVNHVNNLAFFSVHSRDFLFLWFALRHRNLSRKTSRKSLFSYFDGSDLSTFFLSTGKTLQLTRVKTVKDMWQTVKVRSRERETKNILHSRKIGKKRGGTLIFNCCRI